MELIIYSFFKKIVILLIIMLLAWLNRHFHNNEI